MEQLASKRVHIGADKTIAVSSSPFTEAALRAARHHGISTRLISEITEADVRLEANPLEVTVESLDFQVQQMQLHYEGALATAPSLSADALSAWNSLGWTAAIFSVGAGGTAASLEELIGLAAETGVVSAEDGSRLDVAGKSGAAARRDPLSLFFCDLQVGGEGATKDFLLSFDSDTVHAPTTDGPRRLVGIGLRVSATRSATRVDPTHIGQYSTETDVITRFTEHKVEWKPGSTLSVLSRPSVPSVQSISKKRGEREA